MMPKILFITDSIPTKLWLRKHHFNYYKKKKFILNILSIAGFTRQKYYKYTKKLQTIKFHDCNSKIKISSYLNNNIKKKTLVFKQYNKNIKTNFIDDILKKKGIDTAYISEENNLIKKKNIFEIFKIFLLSPFLFIDLLKKKIFYKENQKLHYKVVFTAGKISEKKYISKNTKIIKIHHYDFEKFKEAKPFKFSKKYGVFLSPATFNPDVYDRNPGYLNKLGGNFNNKIYLKNINKFLHSIEKISRNKILVAQHPKDDENLEKLIGFKCFKNKTSELVKNSEFVLCFDSISFQYAILSKKPIIFLTSEYLAPLVKRDILTISDFFKKDPIAIEDKISSTKFKKSLLFKLSIYKKYIKLFLSNTDKKKQNKKRSKIISDYIEKFY